MGWPAVNVMPEKTTALAQRLRQANLRVTVPRVAVLGILAAHPHNSAKVAAELVRKRIGKVSTQAITTGSPGRASG